MQNPLGTFIVIEGSDGSGKGTQFELLKKRLINAGFQVEVFDFPRYDQPSSHFVKRYLNGDYGPASSINPYTASLFFALDRFEAGKDIRKAIESGKVVLCNRYVGSNMAHQGSKFADAIEKRSFFVWEDSLEYQLLNIPRPNLNIFLRVPAEISFDLISKKNKRTYTDKSHDEHEADIEHLRNSVDTYNLLCQLFPRDFKAIDCVVDGKLLDIESISSLLWEEVQPLLPALPKPQVNVEEEITEEESDHPTYSPRSGKLQWELRRVSLLSLLELAKYGLNISVNWEKHWNGNNTKYGYFVPQDLKKEALDSYKEFYAHASKTHAEIVKKLPAAASSHAKACIPLGAYFSATVQVSEERTLAILNWLRLHKNPELKNLYNDLLKLSGVKDMADEKSDEHSPRALSQIMKELSVHNLPQTLSGEESSKIEQVLPRNEFELIADSLYEHSDMSRDEILASLSSLSYDKKNDLLLKSLGDETAQSKTEYTFDLVTDHMQLFDASSTLEKADIQAQPSSVRYGYAVPEEVEESNIDDLYMDLFDRSLELNSLLTGEAGGYVAQFSVLAGHKLRWQLKVCLSDLVKLKKKLPHGAITSLLTELISEFHPIVSQYLKSQSEKRPAKTRK